MAFLEAHLHKSQPLWDGATSRAYSLDDYSLRFLRETFTGGPEDVDATVEYLEVSSRKRYRRDSSTYCNVYASDVCRVLGVYLPRVWWISPGENESQPAVLGRNVREMTANSIFDWLLDYGVEFGWQAVNRADAQTAANCGKVVLIVATKPGGHGHISVLLSGRTEGRFRQSQAGEKNYISSERLGAWWDSPSFKERAFWVNERIRHTNTSAKATHSALKARMPLLGLPAGLFYRYSVRHLRRVLTSEIVEQHFPRNLLEALIVAEDRRYKSHFGFDPIAIARAIWVFIRGRGVQGASTIEQQLVRTLTGRRERTVSRKIREVSLAAYCCGALGKERCAHAYLRVAYFGHGISGVAAAANRLGYDLGRLSRSQAATLIAALRYPLSADSTTLDHRLQRRAQRIAILLYQSGH